MIFDQFSILTGEDSDIFAEEKSIDSKLIK